VLFDHVAHNRDFWDADAGDYQRAHGSQLDATRPKGWGVWHLAESELGVLGEVRGLDVLELGCGAAQWSQQLAAEGAHVVGLDLSSGQLAFARHTAPALPLVLADAERTPFAGDSFDVVFCDHGAMSFCDPARTVPEVARLLRPEGGRVPRPVVLRGYTAPTALRYWCYDAKHDEVGRKLKQQMFGRRRWDAPDGTVDFAIGHGEWIARFRAHGFVIEDLLELRPPKHAHTTYDDYVPLRWARQWPAEEIWRVRKAGGDAR
jgi:SAM-dependent methyltransferase